MMNKPLRPPPIEDSENGAAMFPRLQRRAGAEVSSQKVERADRLRKAPEYPGGQLVVAQDDLFGFDAAALSALSRNATHAFPRSCCPVRQLGKRGSR
jgi:hypothetical protein